MPQIVEGTNLQTPGLRADFWDTYEPMYEGVKARLGAVMKMDVPSNKLTEIFGYYLHGPHPVLWRRGEPALHKAFKSVQFSVINKDWVIGVDWHENDEKDDLTQSLRQRVMDTAQNWALLDERVLFQILQNTSDGNLLDAIPNAPDGASLYSTTDGDGASRFAISGGNIVTGGASASGYATPDEVWEDIWAVKNRLQNMQDGEGQPLWDESILDAGLVMMYGSNAQGKVIDAALKQARSQVIIQNVAGTENVAATSVSNLVQDAGIPIKPWKTSRITDNDLYFFLQSPQAKKPFFKMLRQELREVVDDMSNSPNSRRTKIVGNQWDARYGYGVMLPYATVKVNNP